MSTHLRNELPLSTVLFDVLHLDGVDLIDRADRERRAALELVAPHLAVSRVVTNDADQAQAFYDDVLARGHEGLMAKSLDAPYAAGARGSAWLKIKAAHTLDLVVLAVERGSGRRSKWLSNIHLGARDPTSGGFVMLGKTFKGMTDEILEWQTRTFDALAIRARRLHRVRASGDRRRNCVQRRAAKPALPGRFRAAACTRRALPTGQESERGRYDRARARDLRRCEPQTGRRPRVARASTPTLNRPMMYAKTWQPSLTTVDHHG